MLQKKLSNFILHRSKCCDQITQHFHGYHQTRFKFANFHIHQELEKNFS